MQYATVSDLSARYTERDLRLITDPHAQAVDAERAAQALRDADAEIDAYVERRYVLPLVNMAGQLLAVPAVLVRLACDIAIYRLQTLRPADDIKDARRRYEDVLKLLEAISTGEVSIPLARLRDDVADNPASLSAGMPMFGQPPSLFGRDKR
ncbi:MAG: DUF1320 family protein [Rhodocyclaceae bacterium]|nr:DUF1320 family protein [Rhodocyclaceae bacterium]